MDPAVTGGTRLGRCGELGTDKFRQGGFARSGGLCRIETDFRFLLSAGFDVFCSGFVRMPNPARIDGDLFKAAMGFDAVGAAIDDLRFGTR